MGLTFGTRHPLPPAERLDAFLADMTERNRRQLVRAWKRARAGKPRVRVHLMWRRSAPAAWLVGSAHLNCPIFRFVGPGGARNLFVIKTESDLGKSLQEAWCAFCDQHLNSLRKHDETMTLGPSPVSGKRLGHFPLTSPPPPALPAASGGRGFPAAAGFP